MPRLLLDIGCGSGLSGEALTDEGHAWVGVDISAAMLDVAREREVRRARRRTRALLAVFAAVAVAVAVSWLVEALVDRARCALACMYVEGCRPLCLLRQCPP